MLDPTIQEIANALIWVDGHGDLVDYPCPEDAVRPLFNAMRTRKLVVNQRHKFVVTEAGQAFIRVVRGS